MFAPWDNVLKSVGRGRRANRNTLCNLVRMVRYDALKPNCGGDATTGYLALSSCCVASTATSGQSSVRSGSGGGEQTTDGDSGDTGDGDLQANRFGLDLDGDLQDRLEAGEIDTAELQDRLDEHKHELADQYAEQVARLWDTPKGEWWP